MILGGKHDRPFWFHFFRIEGHKRVHGTDIPRYTKEDKEARIRERQHDPIMPGLTFGDLVKKEISSGMTPLVEYTYQKWHFGRTMIIGDAVHKVGLQLIDARIEAGGAYIHDNLVRAHWRPRRQLSD